MSCLLFCKVILSMSHVLKDQVWRERDPEHLSHTLCESYHGSNWEAEVADSSIYPLPWSRHLVNLVHSSIQEHGDF